MRKTQRAPKSNIPELVAQHIHGSVVRVGGRVDQIMDYKNCRVTDINVLDGGFGDVLKSPLSTNAWRLLRRYVKQEIDYWRIGAAVPRDRKTKILDMHDAYARTNLRDCFDCSISSNVIEHSPNVIWLLLNFYFITKKDGYQFHAIPHYKYTYDCFRKPTPLEHFISDFNSQANRHDKTHQEDYIQSAIIKHGWQKSFHEKYPVAYPFMHFHVFNENNTRALFSYMFEDVSSDVLRTEQFSDNVVIFKNQLRKDFLRKHQKTIDQYISTKFTI